MTEIDYSRPVGWWCAYCEEDGPCFRERVCISMGCKKVPVYLPLPTPEPVEVDEVETGEAEVVTLRDDEDWEGDVWAVAALPDSDGRLRTKDWRCSDTIVNRIAAASANARKKRGMK